jgi:phosphate transport system substrate-binding protein
MKIAIHTSSPISSLFLAVVMLTVLHGWSCQNPHRKKGGKEGPPLETTAIGEISIGIDVTMEPVFRQLVDAFHVDYREATVHPVYSSEGALARAFLADSLRLMLICRPLSPHEQRILAKDQYRATTTTIARDAVVVILHPDNPMDSLTMSQLGRLVRGEAGRWSDLGGESQDSIRLVFDAPQSSTVRMVRDKFLAADQKLPKNAYQTQNQDRVVEYVSHSKSAIGFIGYCQVSDRDDPKVQGILARVKLARLDAADTSDAKGYFIQPYQNEIALGRYPLSRPVYAVSREHFTGLGTGFVSYIAGEIGQRILLKAGLVPEFMPPRVIALPEIEH